MPHMSKQRKRNKLADLLAYLALRVFASILHMFSIDRNLRTGRWIGSVFWWIIEHEPPVLNRVLKRKHREQMLDNLRGALGDQYSEQELLRIARLSCQHLVCLTIELLFTPRLMSLSTWRDYVTWRGDISGALRKLIDRRGVIMITGHYGNWELLGYTLATLGFSIDAVMRPLDNPYLNDYLVRVRARRGLRLLYKKGAAEAMDTILHEGSALCFIADQNAGRKGVFVPFFGRKASTYKSIALLAINQRVPIVVGCARRLGDTFRYEIEVDRIIEPEQWEQQSDPVRWVSAEYNAGLERLIRKDPTQYLWLHRRWKTRPPEELSPEERAAAKQKRLARRQTRADASRQTQPTG